MTNSFSVIGPARRIVFVLVVRWGKKAAVEQFGGLLFCLVIAACGLWLVVMLLARRFWNSRGWSGPPVRAEVGKEKTRDIPSDGKRLRRWFFIGC